MYGICKRNIIRGGPIYNIINYYYGHDKSNHRIVKVQNSVLNSLKFPPKTQSERSYQKICSTQVDTADKWSIKRSRNVWDALITIETLRSKIQTMRGQCRIAF